MLTFFECMPTYAVLTIFSFSIFFTDAVKINWINSNALFPGEIHRISQMKLI